MRRTDFHRIPLVKTLLILIVLSSAGQAQAYRSYKINSGNGSDVLIAREINGNDYAMFSAAAEVLMPGGKYDKSSCSFRRDNCRMKCAAGSFFLLHEETGNIRIAQMLLPALNLDGKIYVPVRTFFQSADPLNLADVVMVDDQISIQFKEKIRINTASKAAKPKKITSKKKTAVKPEKHAEAVFVPDPGNKPLRFYQKLNHGPEDSSIQSGSDNENYGNRGEFEIEYRDTLGDSIPIGNYPGSAIESDDRYIIPKKLKRSEVDELKKQMRDSLEENGNDLNNYYKNAPPMLGMIAANEFNESMKFPEIIDITAEEKDGITEIRVKANSEIGNYHFPEIKDGWFIIRIPDVISRVTDFSKVEGIFPIDSVRLELIRNFILYKFKLSDEVRDISTERNGPRELVYYIYHKKTVRPESKAIVAPPDSDQRIRDYLNRQVLEKEKEKWELDVIVIDAGHGGKDPGAISISGKQEKEHALAIASELRDIIKDNMPGTKVVMTREDDTFIELYRRTQIANQNGGKLFISIHLNSMPKKPYPSNGFETYILRPGKNADAIRVANKENASIKFEQNVEKYKKLTEEEIIISTMAQSAFVRFSELFAQLLQDEVAKTTPMKNRGVNQAGFYVLVGASMPNVLFEAGFLSNEEDEEFITSEYGQKKIAEGMFNAIKRYSIEYKRLISSN